MKLTDIFSKGFFESRKGLFLVTVQVGNNKDANHYTVFDSWRMLIIDPSYTEPIRWPDKDRWGVVLDKLQYIRFEDIYQLYSQNSRFFVPSVPSNDCRYTRRKRKRKSKHSQIESEPSVVHNPLITP
jgi:hypothetical protein